MTASQIAATDRDVGAKRLYHDVVDVIIVNWNSGDQLQTCLRSIARWGGPAIRSVIVVDNASADRSAENLDAGSLKLLVVQAGSNLGFGRACNMGAASAEAPLLLFLNPDAALEENSIEGAVSFILGPDGDDVAVVGIKLIDGDGCVQRHTTSRPTFSKIFTHEQRAVSFDHLHNRIVHHVIGAFYLIRSAVFDDVGRYDERFFMYLEDLDLSDRVNQAGWKIQYLADVQAFHKGGGVSDQIKSTRLFYSMRSRLQYSFKHFSYFGSVFVLFVTLMLEPPLRLVRAISRRSFTEFKETSAAFWQLYKAIPGLLRLHR